MVDDLVDLLGELAIDLGDDRLDRLHRVVADESRVGEGLLGEGFDAVLDRLFLTVRLGLEVLFEEGRELARLQGFCCALRFWICFCHDHSPPSPPPSPPPLESRLQEAGIFQSLLDEFLGIGLAVHVREEVAKLLAGRQQLVERVDLPGDGRG